jgi:hypothetical protein
MCPQTNISLNDVGSWAANKVVHPSLLLYVSSDLWLLMLYMPPHSARLMTSVGGLPRRLNFFVILASCSAFDDTLLNYVFLFFPCFLKVAVLLWQSNAEFLSTALIESVRCKGFDGLALLGRP